MRRFLILILCCMVLTGTVFAAGRADTVRSTTQLYDDGSADVVLTVGITLDEARRDLTFPLPAGAEEVRLDGEAVELQPSKDNEAVGLVSLGHITTAPGSYTLTFRYALPAVISQDGFRENGDPNLTLELPLLSGFAYPVDAMEFAVSFPAGVTGSPVFYSGYFLQSIESDLEYTLEDGLLYGTVTTPMKDKETLRLTMAVNAADFPELVIEDENQYRHLIYMGIAAGAAFLFWLVFLPSLPVLPFAPGVDEDGTPIPVMERLFCFPWRTESAPAGVHAGMVGSCLSMEGADLTMMVFQWAQLGYLHISPNRREEVWLRKRMEMGNERSAFEVRIFRQLFGQNQSVEGTGSRYARLWHQLNSTLPSARQICAGGLGARSVFRLLASLVSALAGAAMAQGILPQGGYWQLALMCVLALLGSFSSWKIQSAAASLHLRRRDDLTSGVVLGLFWLAAGLLCQRPLAGVISVAFQFLVGIFAAWGGRRTRLGRQLACQLLALRHYLTGAKRRRLRKELERNPDFFFEMAPYALAFGVEDTFAKRFGRHIMPQCNYMDAGRSEKRTAREWAYIMRQTAEKLDNSAKKKQYRA